MISPTRLQLSRRKGFNLQAVSLAANGLTAVKADRSTRLGNPFRVTAAKTTRAGKPETVWVVGSWTGPAIWIREDKQEAIDISMRAYREWMGRSINAPILDNAIETARGKNIACWCALGSPCHADVILELANSTTGL